MLYSAESGVRRKTPAFGRLTPGCRRRQLEQADVEIALAALERFLGEERADEPRRILAELRHLRRRVALADDEQVDLGCRRSVLEQRRDRRAARLRRAPR